VRPIVFALVLVACTAHKPVASTGSAAQPPGAPAATMNAAVTIKYVGRKPGKPPMDRILVDIQLKNDNATPRWVLIPTNLPQGTGGIDKLEQLMAPAGTTSVAVGRFLGSGGRYALRLAPGARVALHKLEVAWWRADQEAGTVFEVQLASDVKLGDETMASWFGKDPTISGVADVDMEAAQHTASHRAKDDAEVPVEVSGGTRAPIKLTAP
jgi:hypothetical protein